MVMIKGSKDEIPLKFKGTFSHEKNYAYLTHHNEAKMSFSLFWHARFGHIIYGILCLFKKNGVSDLPTFPRNLKQCHGYTLENIANKNFMIPILEHVGSLD